jgi:hypothetical protein
MRVVPAGVHDIDLAAEKFHLGLGGEGKARRLLHRQRVHVGPQRHDRAGLGALEQADDAGVGDAGLHFKAEAGEVGSDERGRARLLLAQLWMLVDVAPPGDQLAFDCRRTLSDFLLQVRNRPLRLRRHGRRQKDERQQKAKTP